MEERYHIDLAWLKEQGRSFPELARSRLCARCRGRKLTKPEEFFQRFQECCQEDPDFFQPRISVREAIFRVFLLRGNQPLTPEEVAEELKPRHHHPPSPAVVSRMLQADSLYGIRPVSSPPGDP